MPGFCKGFYRQRWQIKMVCKLEGVQDVVEGAEKL
jgi:hypothetical protein